MQNQVIREIADPEYTIISKILDGQLDLFEVFIRRYNSVLYKIARTYGFGHQDAEDLMQDTHVAAYTALAGFEGRSSYKTWISKIMVRKCLNKLNAASNRREVSTELLPVSGFSIVNLSASGDATDKKILNDELSLILEKSMQGIPAMYRTVFVLREVEGFSVSETSDILNISPINVKVRLNRAKKMLQDQISQTYSYAELYSFNLVYCDAIVDRVLLEIRLI
jgi:RNA polymerase sigma-70 factor (ECF subfamily)